MEWLNSTLTFVAICTAIYGIDSWRRELVGKRQIELAEDTLALFYEASDTIKYMRSSLGFSHEFENIERKKGESDIDFEARKSASIIFYRYEQKQDLFNKIHASRYRFMAQIGKNKAAPFDDIRTVTNEILSSARTLSRLWAKNHFRTDQQLELHQNEIKKYEAIFYDSGSDDEINKKVDALIQNIEETCAEVIGGKGTIFSFLNRKV